VSIERCVKSVTLGHMTWPRSISIIVELFGVDYRGQHQVCTQAPRSKEHLVSVRDFTREVQCGFGGALSRSGIVSMVPLGGWTRLNVSSLMLSTSFVL
jgi:hypothetical protein